MPQDRSCRSPLPGSSLDIFGASLFFHARFSTLLGEAALLTSGPWGVHRNPEKLIFFCVRRFTTRPSIEEIARLWRLHEVAPAFVELRQDDPTNNFQLQGLALRFGQSEQSESFAPGDSVAFADTTTASLRARWCSRVFRMGCCLNKLVLEDQAGPARRSAYATQLSQRVSSGRILQAARVD